LLIPRFVSEFKTISNLDIHETDLPQLGRYELSFNNKLYCFIISTYPCFNGEKIAINVYQPPKSINNYGMSENDLNKLFSALDETGIIQIKGGQNSGKTLFIYSLLSNIENKRIITLESKIKYAINSATQCEINNDVGFNLKTALDYLNFQNPDIVYIENIFSIEDFELIKKLSNLKTVIIETNLAIRNVNCKILINNGMAEIETQTPDLSLVSA